MRPWLFEGHIASVADGDHVISVPLENDACADMLMYGAWNPPLTV
jgi:hypothetical protein